MNEARGRVDYFQDLYGASDDPYGLQDRWYERRKRDVLLAALPRERYASAYEPGCGSAELTVQLAKRCDTLLASDFSDRAVDIARQRTAGIHNVKIEQHVLPHDWPLGTPPFDLIVLSELGYFLDASAMREVAARCGTTLAPGGTLVACNWRPDFEERVLPTAQVHGTLAGIGLARIALHEEDDFLLEVWSRDPRSVAQHGGIR